MYTVSGLHVDHADDRERARRTCPASSRSVPAVSCSLRRTSWMLSLSEDIAWRRSLCRTCVCPAFVSSFADVIADIQAAATQLPGRVQSISDAPRRCNIRQWRVSGILAANAPRMSASARPLRRVLYASHLLLEIDHVSIMYACV